MNSIDKNQIWKTPSIHIDVTNYEAIYIKVGPCTYKLNVQKLVKDYGELISIVYDNKTEE